MDITQYVEASFVIIGFVNGVQFAIDRNWASFVKFLVAVLAGGVFGSLHFFGLPSVEVGLAVAIGSSGVYKVGQVISGK